VCGKPCSQPANGHASCELPTDLDCTFPYLDDIFVFSKGEEEHLQHLVTVKDLQNFLGVVNFYRKFVPGAADILRPLTDALRKSPAARLVVEWMPERRVAFQAGEGHPPSFPQAGR
jgi:hypothetical protein